VKHRESFFYQHLADYYKLGAPQPLTVNNRISPTEQKMLNVTVNGIPLTRGVMNGKFFKDRKLTIEARTTDDSKTVTGWKVLTVKANGTEEKTYNGETLTQTMPECTKLMADAIIGENPNGITSPTTGTTDNTGNTKCYNMQGQDVTGQSLKPGLYIIKRGGKSMKVTIPQK